MVAVVTMRLAPGLVSSVQVVVTDADTATAMGTGDVPVLACSRLLALADAAAVAAITSSLESGVTSVSTSAAMEYKQPCPIGAEVVVWAELTEVRGRHLWFNVIARRKGPTGATDDGQDVVAAGTVERVLVDRDQFVSRLRHP